LVSINEVNLRRAWLVLGWLTMFGLNSRCEAFISECDHPPRSIQPGHPFVGRTPSTTEMLLRSEFCPGPHRGGYSAPLDPLAESGATSQQEAVRKGRKERRKRIGWKGRDRGIETDKE